MTSLKRGFTLIELLVVIAIIGILSSVVLASLNTARGKGADATAKSELNSMRAQAELVYDNATPNSYAGVCSNLVVVKALTNAAAAEGVSTTGWTTTSIINSAGNIVCNNTAGNWAIGIGLFRGPAPTTWWCSDNTGTAKIELTLSAMTTSITACP